MTGSPAAGPAPDGWARGTVGTIGVGGGGSLRGTVVHGNDELDDVTSAVLDESARLVDESRRLLRRVDRLLDRRSSGRPVSGAGSARRRATPGPHDR